MKKRLAKKKGKGPRQVNRQRETELAADLAETFDQLIDTEDRLLKARLQADYCRKALDRSRRQLEEERVQAKQDTRRALFAGLALGVVIAVTTAGIGLSVTGTWALFAGFPAVGK